MLRIVHLPATLYSTWHNLYNQQKFLRKQIYQVIQDAMANNDGSLDEDDCRKIKNYYGLAVPAVLAEAICSLHGKSLSQKERWASTCQGAMTGIFDDFFDKDYLLGNEIPINQLFENSDNKKAKIKLFDYFFQEAINNVPDKTVMLKCLQDVHDAQIESKAQCDEISINKLKEITRLKGGYSLLFYRSAIDAKLSADESKVLFEAGALMQLCNDIFDVYKDREDNIRTLATKCNINELQEYFYANLLHFKEMLWSLPSALPGKKKFYNLISIAVFNRAMVCLEQFRSIQIREGVFNIHKLTRKDLICDMDTMKNKLKSAVYFIK